MGWLGHMAVPYLVAGGISLLFPTEAAPFSTPFNGGARLILILATLSCFAHQFGEPASLSCQFSPGYSSNSGLRHLLSVSPLWLGPRGLRPRTRVPTHRPNHLRFRIGYFLLPNSGKRCHSFLIFLFSSGEGDLTVRRSFLASFGCFSALEATEVDQTGSQKPRCTESKTLRRIFSLLWLLRVTRGSALVRGRAQSHA